MGRNQMQVMPVFQSFITRKHGALGVPPVSGPLRHIRTIPKLSHRQHVWQRKRDKGGTGGSHQVLCHQQCDLSNNHEGVLRAEDPPRCRPPPHRREQHHYHRHHVIQELVAGQRGQLTYPLANCLSVSFRLTPPRGATYGSTRRTALISTML